MSFEDNKCVVYDATDAIHPPPPPPESEASRASSPAGAKSTPKGTAGSVEPQAQDGEATEEGEEGEEEAEADAKSPEKAEAKFESLLKTVYELQFNVPATLSISSNGRVLAGGCDDGSIKVHYIEPVFKAEDVFAGSKAGSFGQTLTLDSNNTQASRKCFVSFAPRGRPESSSRGRFFSPKSLSESSTRPSEASLFAAVRGEQICVCEIQEDDTGKKPFSVRAAHELKELNIIGAVSALDLSCTRVVAVAAEQSVSLFYLNEIAPEAVSAEASTESSVTSLADWRPTMELQPLRNMSMTLIKAPATILRFSADGAFLGCSSWSLQVMHLPNKSTLANYIRTKTLPPPPKIERINFNNSVSMGAFAWSHDGGVLATGSTIRSLFPPPTPKLPNTVHPGTRCDRTDVSPIEGTRYHFPGAPEGDDDGEPAHDLCQEAYDQITEEEEKNMYQPIEPPDLSASSNTSFGDAMAVYGCPSAFGIKKSDDDESNKHVRFEVKLDQLPTDCKVQMGWATKKYFEAVINERSPPKSDFWGVAYHHCKTATHTVNWMAEGETEPVGDEEGLWADETTIGLFLDGTKVYFNKDDGTINTMTFSIGQGL